MGPPDELDTLGARLKYVREKVLRWSARKAQRELSASGVDIESHTTVLRYEKDERVPGADYVTILAVRAGVTTDWLLTGTGPRTRAHADAVDPYSEGVMDTVRRMREQLARIEEELGVRPTRREGPPTEQERAKARAGLRAKRRASASREDSKPKPADSDG